MKKAKIIFGSVLSAMIILTACQKDDITPPLVDPIKDYKSEVANIPSIPVRISITKITVENFPALTPRGRTWDFSATDVVKLPSNWTNPDIYPVITYRLDRLDNPEQTLVNLESQFSRDAINTREYSWYFRGLVIQYPTKTHRFALYDHDGKTSQLMGVIDFTPYDRGYPDQLYISDGNLSFILDVQYQWLD